MFQKGCTDPVTLGIYTTKSIENTPIESKIGGNPVWLTNQPNNSRLHCKYCHDPLRFVSQIYAPDQFDRVLYIFGCMKNECSKHSDSWICIRQQSDSTIVEEPKEEKIETKSAFSFSSLSAMNWDGGDFSQTTNVATQNNDNDDILNLLNAMNQPQTKPNQKKNKNKDTNIQVNKVPSSKEDNIAFPAYHVDFIEEPEEKKISKNYQIKDMETSSGNNEEKYDDDSKSKLIIKFYSRINRSPKQVIRYAYDGLPLLPCQPPTKINPPRCKCGGERLFECQILSSVLSLFHIDDDINLDSATNPKDLLASKYMDFSSLLIYCCENSCNDCDEEYIYVLPPL